MGKIYLLETHLYTKDGEHVYKVGRSDQKGMNRLKDYHKECEIILVIACEDSIQIEAELLNRFKQKYTLYTHREYFVGDKHQMMDDIIEVVRKERVGIEKECLEKVEKEWPAQSHNTIGISKIDDPCLYPKSPALQEMSTAVMLNRSHKRIPFSGFI